MEAPIQARQTNRQDGVAVSPPSSNWLRPTTYTREALDVSAILVQIQAEVF